LKNGRDDIQEANSENSELFNLVSAAFESIVQRTAERRKISRTVFLSLLFERLFPASARIWTLSIISMLVN
jgi:hypothetical protein